MEELNDLLTEVDCARRAYLVAAADFLMLTKESPLGTTDGVFQMRKAARLNHAALTRYRKALKRYSAALKRHARKQEEAGK